MCFSHNQISNEVLLLLFAGVNGDQPLASPAKSMSSADGVEERSSREVKPLFFLFFLLCNHLYILKDLFYTFVFVDFPDEGSERRRKWFTGEVGQEEEQEIPHAIILEDQRQEIEGEEEFEAVASLSHAPTPASALTCEL